MPTPIDRPSHDNTYFVDPSLGAELGRLFYQDRLMTKSMGGLLPELDAAIIAGTRNVLDIACGPGGWALDLAFEHQHMSVVGIDLSETMIEYARVQASVQEITNASFLVMDVLKPLNFPDASFDLVNARFISGFMPKTTWPRLINECRRILRPSGILRLTEFEFGISNSPAHERMSVMGLEAMVRAGMSFSPDGRHLCIIPMLPRFLRDAGFQSIQRRTYSVDYSFGAETHQIWHKNLLALWKLGEPFVINMGVVTQEEFERAYQRASTEMLSENFCAVWFVVTALGEKPRAEDAREAGQI